MNLSQAIVAELTSDAELVSLLATYRGSPAIFTADPAPGDAVMPFLVTAGSVSDIPFDTKTGWGREFRRDVRVYASATGSAALVDQIAERVRKVLHRNCFPVSGLDLWVVDCQGPIVADESDCYGRVLTLYGKGMEGDES